MVVLVGLWPLTIALYFAGIALLVRRAWVHRKDKGTARTIVECLMLQILMPLMAFVWSEMESLPRFQSSEHDLIMPSGDALVWSIILLILLASLITGMAVGRKKDIHKSKKRYFILALVVLPSLGYFLGFYLQGRGFSMILIWWMLFGTVSMVLGPFIVATPIVLIVTRRWLYRILLFLPVVLLAVPFFWLVPPGNTAEMMGRAHRLRAQFPVDQIREAADAVRQKYANGTLQTNPDNPQRYQFAAIVNESELPDLLKGRFEYVGLRPCNKGDIREIVFAINVREGIVCNTNSFEKNTSHYSMGPYVHAYCYRREN